MKNTFGKRFFAMLLALVLCMSLLPTAAFADEEPVEEAVQTEEVNEEAPAEEPAAEPEVEPAEEPEVEPAEEPVETQSTPTATTLYVDAAYTAESCGGHTWGVDAFSTIQAAVDAADVSAGAVTVSVAAGTYSETVVMNGKTNLFFNEDKYIGRLHFIADGNVILNGQFTFGNDSVQSQDIADVEVTGFTINNQYGVYIMNSGTASRDIVIKNNIFSYSGYSYGVIYVNSGAVDGLTVSGNTVSGCTGYAASFGAQGGTINNATVSGNTFCSYIGVFGSVGADGVTVSGNIFTGAASGDENVWIKNTKAADIGKITLSGNTFSDVYGYVIGFNLTYHTKADIVIGASNTYGGRDVTGWAETANDKFLVSKDMYKGEAQYYDKLLYLGDETSFKSASAAMKVATEAGTLVFVDGAAPVELAVSAIIVDTLVVDSAWSTRAMGETLTVGGKNYYYGVNAFSNMDDAIAAMSSDTAKIILQSDVTWGNTETMYVTHDLVIEGNGHAINRVVSGTEGLGVEFVINAKYDLTYTLTFDNVKFNGLTSNLSRTVYFEMPVRLVNGTVFDCYQFYSYKGTTEVDATSRLNTNSPGTANAGEDYQVRGNVTVTGDGSFDPASVSRDGTNTTAQLYVPHVSMRGSAAYTCALNLNNTNAAVYAYIAHNSDGSYPRSVSVDHSLLEVGRRSDGIWLENPGESTNRVGYLYTETGDTMSIANGSIARFSGWVKSGGALTVSGSELEVGQYISNTGSLTLENATLTTGTNFAVGGGTKKNGNLTNTGTLTLKGTTAITLNENGAFSNTGTLVFDGRTDTLAALGVSEGGTYKLINDAQVTGTAVTSSLNVDGSSLFKADSITLGAAQSITLGYGTAALIETADIANAGTITVDMTGATEKSYKLIDYTGTGTKTLGDYGTATVTGSYVLKVEDNDLYAVTPETYLVCKSGEATLNGTTGKYDYTDADGNTVSCEYCYSSLADAMQAAGTTVNYCLYIGSTGVVTGDQNNPSQKLIVNSETNDNLKSITLDKNAVLFVGAAGGRNKVDISRFHGTGTVAAYGMVEIDTAVIASDFKGTLGTVSTVTDTCSFVSDIENASAANNLNNNGATIYSFGKNITVGSGKTLSGDEKLVVNIDGTGFRQTGENQDAGKLTIENGAVTGTAGKTAMEVNITDIAAYSSPSTALATLNGSVVGDVVLNLKNARMVRTATFVGSDSNSYTYTSDVTGVVDASRFYQTTDGAWSKKGYLTASMWNAGTGTLTQTGDVDYTVKNLSYASNATTTIYGLYSAGDGKSQVIGNMDLKLDGNTAPGVSVYAVNNAKSAPDMAVLTGDLSLSVNNSTMGAFYGAVNGTIGGNYTISVTDSTVNTFAVLSGSLASITGTSAITFNGTDTVKTKVNGFGSVTIASGATLCVKHTVSVDYADAWTNNGTLSVDMTGATADSYLLVDYTGTGTKTLADYGTVTVSEGYRVKVKDNDLYAVKAETIIVNPDQEDNKTTAVTTEVDSSVSESRPTSMPVEVKEQVDAKTTVSGVKLTMPTAEAQTGSGLQKVIEAAKENSSEVKTAIEKADKDIDVKVDVQVTASAYEAPTVGSDTGVITFDLKPIATVTVDGKSTTVEVTNDMIDQLQDITVELYTGFDPALIVHHTDANEFIESFSGSAIDYNETTGVATVVIHRFSGLTSYEKDYAAQIGTTNYETLEKALADAKSGDTVTLLKDATMTAASTIDESIKLNGNGFLLTLNDANKLLIGKVGTPITVTAEDLTVGGGNFYIVDGSTVTFSGNGFDLDQNDDSFHAMIENAAEEKNSWNGDTLNHIGNTINITNVTDAVNGFKTFALYTNSGSAINVTDSARVFMEFLNIYGGTFTMTGGALGVDQNINITGDATLTGVDGSVSYVNVYAADGGYNGGKLHAVNSTLDGADWQMKVGNKRDGSKYYEKGTDSAAVLELTNTTVKSSDFINSGIVRMDAASSIVLTASGENSFKGAYHVNGGIIEVDMTGATADSIKLIDCAASSDFGTADTNYKFATGKNNDYVLVVKDNDLYAEKAAAKITRSGTSTIYSTLEDALADAKSGDTVTMLRDADWDVNTSWEAGEFTYDLPDGVTLDLGGKTITVTNLDESFSYSFCSTGSFTFSNGSIRAENTDDWMVEYCGKNTSSKLIFDGIEFDNAPQVKTAKTTFKNCKFAGCFNIGFNAEVEIESGEYDLESINVNSGSGFTISGGTFKQDVSEYCTKGFACKDNGDGTYTVGDPVASITTGSGAEAVTTYYATVQKAVANAGSGDTVLMLEDSTENVTVEGGKTVTLDLANKTLTGTGSGSVITVKGALTIADTAPASEGDAGVGVITGGSAENGGGIYVDTTGTLTLTGGKITGNTATGNGGGVYSAAGNITVSGKVEITGNKVGDNANNLFLKNGQTVTVAAEGLSGAAIGVTLEDGTGAVTAASSADYSAFFASDESYGLYNEKASDDNQVVKLGSVTAQIVETGVVYATVQEAVTAATNGQTVKLLADTKEAVTIQNKTLTLDLNSKTLSYENGCTLSVTGTANVTVTDSSAAKTGMISAAANSDVETAAVKKSGGGTFTLVGGKLCATGTADCTGNLYGLQNTGTGTQVLSGGTIEVTGAGTNNFAGVYSYLGTTQASGTKISVKRTGTATTGKTTSGVQLAGSAAFEISGGSVDAQNANSNPTYGVYSVGSGALTFSGGTVTALGTGTGAVVGVKSTKPAITLSGSTVKGKSTGNGNAHGMSLSGAAAATISGGASVGETTGSGNANGISVSGSVAITQSAGAVCGTASGSGAAYGINSTGTGAITLGGGTVTATSGGTGAAYGVYTSAAVSGDITVEGCAVSAEVTSTDGGDVYGMKILGSGALAVESGSVDGKQVANKDCFGIAVGGEREMNLSGGSLTAETSGNKGCHALRTNDSASLSMSAGTVKATAKGTYHSCGICNNGTGTVSISGGEVISKAVKASNSLVLNALTAGGEFDVTGGQFDGKLSVGDGKFNITGGEFSKDPTNYLEETSCAEPTGTDPYIYQVSETEATVTDGGKTTRYSSLSKAMASTKDGDTVKLMKDITVTEGFTVSRQVTFDMNGKTITYAPTYTRETYKSLFDVTSTGDLTVTGKGTITGPTGDTAAAYDGKTMITVDAGKLTFKDGTMTCGGNGSDGMYGVYVKNGGTATLGVAKDGETAAYGPTIESWFAAIGTNNTTAPAVITVEAGSYTALADPKPSGTELWWHYFCAPVYAASNGTFTINGGSFTGYYGISSCYSNTDQTTLVNGGTFTCTDSALYLDSQTGVAYTPTGGRVVQKASAATLAAPTGYYWKAGAAATDPATLTEKGTPAASDFTFTPPTSTTYDGNAKTAEVKAKDTVTGMGTVSVKYYSDAECTTEVADADVKDADTYYVGITVTEGDEYLAATDVITDSSWTFDISKSDAPAAPTVTVDYVNEKTNEDIADTIEYKKSTDTTWTTGAAAKIALDPNTTYQFRVKETDNVKAGTETEITIPARPATPTVAIDYAAETADTAATQEYSTDSGANWTDCTANMSASDWADKTILVRVKAVTTTGSEAFCSGNQSITVAARPATPTVAIDYAAETADTAATQEYSTDNGANWTDCTANMSASDWADKTVRVRVKAVTTTGSEAFCSESQSITVAARPATPTVTVNYAAETADTVATQEYSTDNGANWTDCTANMSASDWADKTVRIRVKAVTTTGSEAFCSESQSITVAARPATPTVAIDYAAETADTAATQEYSTDNGASWTDCTANMSASDWADKTVLIRVKAVTTSGSEAFCSGNQSITVAARPATPTVTVNYAAETADTVATQEYSTDDGANWTDCTADMSVADWFGETVLVRVKAVTTTGSEAFCSGNQSITAAARPATPNTTNYAVDNVTQVLTTTPTTGFEIAVKPATGAPAAGNWADVPATGYTLTADTRYLLRVKATATTPASAACELGSKTTVTLSANGSVKDQAWTGKGYSLTAIENAITAKQDAKDVTSEITASPRYTYTWTYEDGTAIPKTACDANGVPVAVGSYKVTIAINPEEPLYKGTTEALSFSITPVATDARGNVIRPAVQSYDRDTDGDLVYYTSADSDDFVSVTVKAATGSLNRALTTGEYTVAPDTTVTLKKSFLATLSPDAYTITVVSKLPGSDPEKTASVSFAVAISQCEHSEKVSIKEGTYTIKVGGIDIGVYTVAKSDSGWTLKGQRGYLAYKDGKVIDNSQSAYVWQYDGGFYTPVATTVYMLWIFPHNVVTNYYINSISTVVTEYTYADLYQYVVVEHHSFVYVDNGNGTHNKICEDCGKVFVKNEKCTYGTDHLCKSCGHRDPDSIKINVTITKLKTYNSKLVTRILYGNYTYSAVGTYTVDGDTVTKVEYSTDGRSFSLGHAYTAYKDFDFYLRLTTASGSVTTWKYANGQTVQVK